jgi:hypothetical protein
MPHRSSGILEVASRSRSRFLERLRRSDFPVSRKIPELLPLNAADTLCSKPLTKTEEKDTITSTAQADPLISKRNLSKQAETPLIDHIREVRDAKTLDDLNRQLVKEIKSGSPNACWMAPDGIIDWNQIAYFQFGSAQGAPRFSNLALERFIEHLGGPKKLTPDAIERTRVRA